MFQNLRQGNTIYVIDKSGVPSLKLGQVVSVSNPTPVYNNTTPITIGLQAKTEVLVRAKVDDKEGDFPHLPSDQNVHDYGNMVVTDSREAALSEIEALKQFSQSVIDSVPHHEESIIACEEIAKSLNPNYAKEKERDEAIGRLSGRLDGIEENMVQILKLLNKK